MSFHGKKMYSCASTITVKGKREPAESFKHGLVPAYRDCVTYIMAGDDYSYLLT